MEFGTKQLIGLILVILGVYFVIRMAGGIFWVILIIIGAYLLLKDNLWKYYGIKKWYWTTVKFIKISNINFQKNLLNIWYR